MSIPRHDESFTCAHGAALDLHYDRISMLLHWIMATIVPLLWVIAHLIDTVPKGEARIAVRSLHIILGALLGLLLLVRLTWRIGWGQWLPVPQPGLLGNVATLLHWGLYVMLAGTVLLGITNAWIRGDTVIGLFTIPSLAPGDKALKNLIENLHDTFANVLLIAAGLHALACLFHHFVLRDDVLRRMLPRTTPR